MRNRHHVLDVHDVKSLQQFLHGFFACMGHFLKIPCPSKTFLLPICFVCACLLSLLWSSNISTLCMLLITHLEDVFLKPVLLEKSRLLFFHIFCKFCARYFLCFAYKSLLKIFSPSSMVVYGWLLEASEDVHKTKKLGINGHNNISKGHQLPM